MIEENLKWSKVDIGKLLGLVSSLGALNQWKKIASSFSNKTEIECKEFYDFLMGCANRIIQENETGGQKNVSGGNEALQKSDEILNNKPIIKDKKKKRVRRKATQIERLYKCQEKHCNRSYGTEGALKMHIKTKHPSVKYDAKYQIQARNASLINKKKEEDYDDDDDDDDYEQSSAQSDTLLETSLILSKLPYTTPKSKEQPTNVTPSFNYSPITYPQNTSLSINTAPISYPQNSTLSLSINTSILPPDVKFPTHINYQAPLIIPQIISPTAIKKPLLEMHKSLKDPKSSIMSVTSLINGSS
jgi:hypothetical protein